MPSDFVQQVLAFLDVEAHGSGYASYALDAAYDFLNQGKEGDCFLEDSERIRTGELTSFIALKERVFPDATEDEIVGSGTDLIEQLILAKRSEEDDPKVPTAGRLDRIFARGREEQELLELLAKKMGISIQDAQDYLSQAAEDGRVSKLRSPSLHRFLLRKYVLRLDKMADNIETLQMLPIAWKGVPAHLRTLLSNAHEAYLLGQEVSCAILCGTALEEALKFRLGDRFENVPQSERRGIAAYGISMAFKDGIIGSVEENSAREINSMRNRATHDPGDYLVTPDRKKRDLLVNTRFVISKLFSGSGLK